MPVNSATRRPPSRNPPAIVPDPPASTPPPASQAAPLPSAAPVAAVNAAPSAALDAFAGDPNFMTSLARGLLVIQSFTPQTPQMTISQLAASTGLSRAAVRRCLYTLSKLGFAGIEDGSRYALRPRMLTLSNSYSTSNCLSTAAQPILERMSAALHESFSVATLDGDDIVYIARSTVSR
ncbi:MAG TPA: helix-turn-helix domain-containing protein, partial [Acidobacteriaceae bacterium]|nr:helix-turn-helix domain-containing protein [Acidobacteriaceae bacterium]